MHLYDGVMSKKQQRKGWLNRLWLLTSLLIMSFALVAQSTPVVDSLERELAKGIGPKVKIKAMQELALAYMNENPERCIVLSMDGLRLSDGMGDEFAKAAFYYYLGGAYYRKGNYDSTAVFLEQAMTLSKEIKDSKQEAAVYQLYGQLFRKQGKYSEAIAQYLEAVKIAEQRQDEKQLSSMYVGIGATHQLMKNYDQAKEYLLKAEEIALRHDYKKTLGDVYISLSDIYAREGKDKEKTLFYAKRSLEVAEEQQDVFGQVEGLQALALTYMFYGEYEHALRYVDRSITLAEKLGNDQLLAYSLITASNIHYGKQEYTACIETAKQAFVKDSTNTNLQINIFSNLANAFSFLNQPDSAEYYLGYCLEVLSNHANESYQASLSELEVKYETEKNGLKIMALEEQRQLYIWLTIAAGLIVLIGLGYGIIRYRLAVSKRKLAEKENQQLEQEKQLVAVQATLDGETAERTRLAKDLHDGLGSMLSVVKLNLPQMKGDAWLESVDVSRFQAALGMLDDSIHELRRVAHHMMPEALLRFGLKVSISDFCDAIPMTDFHYFGDEARLPEKLEIMVYRCIHELVNNALKHAKANHINVQLVQESDRLSFTVQDDGIGFDQNAIVEGMGLRNIRQRIEAFRGKMNIYSSEQGTEIHVELEPTKNEQE